jgi:hypothetical protein
MRTLLLVSVAALVWAAPAGAKELLGAQLCGPAGCATERHSAVLHGPGGPFEGELATPAKPGPWYRGYLLAGDNGKVMGKLLFYYVPAAHELVQPGRFGQTTTWTRAGAKLLPMLERLSLRVEPYEAPRFTRVTVDEKNVKDPQSYARLWTVGANARDYPRSDDQRLVIFFTAAPTPWSDANYVVAYPSDRLLMRDGQLVAINEDVADAIAEGRSMAPSDSSRPWLWALVIVPVAALAGVRPLRRRLH